jgi:hypothetical protein
MFSTRKVIQLIPEIAIMRSGYEVKHYAHECNAQYRRKTTG